MSFSSFLSHIIVFIASFGMPEWILCLKAYSTVGLCGSRGGLTCSSLSRLRRWYLCQVMKAGPLWEKSMALNGRPGPEDTKDILYIL